MDLERKTVGLRQKPALVLVDMINGFTSSACPLGTDCPEVVAANKTLLNAFREKGLPVFFTTVVYHHEEQARVFRDRIEALNLLTPDSDWVKIDSALAMEEGEVLIEKQFASAFFGTLLAQQLEDQAVDDRNREAHAASLHDLNAKYADVVKVDEVIEYIEDLEADMFDLPTGNPE